MDDPYAPTTSTLNANGRKQQAMADFCFELSWEVCNKVGGIYTVVRTKVPSMIHHYLSNYIVMGPYVALKANSEFVEEVPPEAWRRVFEQAKSEGIICHYGKWVVKGEPTCILVEYANFAHQKDAIKGKFWEAFQIDSWGSNYFDYDEPLLWAVACGKIIHAFSQQEQYAHKHIVVQCHEWLAAGAALYLKTVNSHVASVFTTHATMLGRTLAGANSEFYDLLSKFDAKEEAYKYGIQTKFLTEKAAAHNSDVFTTVSEITAIEAQYLLGKKPDMLLPNGLDIESFPTFEEVAIKHSMYKARIREFLMTYFFPSYSFDIDNTLLLFISARYEFHGKGVDVLIKALSKVNQKFKQQPIDKTVVAFFWVPGNIKNIKPEIIQSKQYYEDILQSVDDNLQNIRSKIISSILSKKDVSIKDFFLDENSLDLKTKVLRFLKKKGDPPICTHDLYNEEHDEILNALKTEGLTNKESDHVKVIFYPMYLMGADGLLDTNNYESMIGCHLGIFPSYYEPWGYTPLECSTLGVASVTTDLAGFGRYIEMLKKALTHNIEGDPDMVHQTQHQGIFVLKRMGVRDEDVVDQLASVIESYARFPKELRINEKLEARRLASQCDWLYFVNNYVHAHNQAIQNMKQRITNA